MRLALAAALALALGAGACAPGDVKIDVDAEIFIIVDGPGAGTILETPPGSPLVRSSGPAAYPVNALWPADGVITLHAAGCDGNHFHGQLSGQADPDPAACGWGTVISWHDASAEAHDLAGSFAFEQIAGALVRDAPDDEAANRRAVQLLERSMSLLRDMPFYNARLNAKIGAIRQRDDAAADTFADDEATDEDLQEALDDLADAIELKAELMRDLWDNGWGLKDEGGCTIVGSPGPDILRGTPRRDVACGLGGADVILGLGGADILIGGEGPDRLNGGAGADVLRGGWGIDRLETGPGRDRPDGGAGRDWIDGKRERR